jgi:YhcH/YjgK/YiaL family protein
MIIDTLSACEKYFCLNPGFAEAFHFLKNQPEVPALDTRVQIKGDLIYASYMRRPGKTREAAKMEAHRRYIDIQFLISGNEEISWKATPECSSPDGDYNPERDVLFFKDAPDSWHALRPGQFVIFYPGDTHAPMVGSGELTKVVVKVALDFK